jgi:hypothetical protein
MQFVEGGSLIGMDHAASPAMTAVAVPPARWRTTTMH